ncbi:MAG: histidine phosphatase family protein, partial [Planctomycetes bacterium]|nr:histidine phosphatase family protein [Planctomycetota bacterium]
MSTWVLYLIRHAQSENNAKPDAERIPDPGITPLGVEQSERLAASIDRYRPTRLYCSPFLRSLQTLSPVAKKLQLQPRVRQDLYEQGGCHRGYVDGQR